MNRFKQVLGVVRSALLLIVLGIITGVVSAQTGQIPQSPALLAYSCTFDRGANRLHIQAVMQSEVPGPVFGDYTIRVTPAGTDSPIDERAVTTVRVNPRPPLQMVVLFDITDTVPVTESAQAVIDGLLPNLQPSDQVAFITFDENVSLPTPFFTDKAALADQFIRGLTIGRGDNRVYNALLAATNAFPFSTQTRRVVVLVGDSGRRDDPQAPESEVATLAQQLKVQIYPVAFTLRDNPDVEALLDISAASRGFTFLYRERNTTRQALQTTITTYLQELVRGLDSEIELAIDPTGIVPNAENEINLTLTAEGDGLGSYVLTDQIVCPYQEPVSDIRFVTPLGDTPITGQVDIGVVVDTDLDREATRVVFRVNDEVVQTSESLIYTFDATTVPPGAYLIRAELWDLQNNTIAVTETTQRVVAQQRITLGLTAGRDPNALQGAVEFIAGTRSEFPLTQAVFTLAPISDPDAVQPLGQVPFRADGTAVLSIGDIRSAVQRVLPNTEPGDVLILGATVPGIAAGDPPLAIAEQSLRFAYSVPTVVVETRPLTPIEVAITFVDYTVLYWAAGALVIANLILVMMARRAKIRRMILTPDKIDLSPQLMNITVLNNGVRHSHTLTKKTVMLGRGASNDINLGDSQSVSRQHGVVMWRKGDWWYTNRKTGVTTEIEGRKRRGLYLQLLEPVTELRMGDEVVVLFHSNAQQDISEFIKTDL